MKQLRALEILRTIDLFGKNVYPSKKTIDEAIAELEALQAENAVLRERLQTESYLKATSINEVLQTHTSCYGCRGDNTLHYNGCCNCFNFCNYKLKAQQ